MNQCMGCQAGWPTREIRIFGRSGARLAEERSMLLHEVVGGYPNEVMGCERYMYQPSLNTEPPPRDEVLQDSGEET